MPRPVHFEIHASDPQRAIAFYAGLFGWEFKNWGGPMEYWLVTTGPDGQPGINGGLIKRQGDPPVDMAAVNAYVCTIDVGDIDAYMKKAASAGAPGCAQDGDSRGRLALLLQGHRGKHLRHDAERSVGEVRICVSECARGQDKRWAESTASGGVKRWRRGGASVIDVRSALTQSTIRQSIQRASGSTPALPT
jgi:uncharacterized protein